MTSSALAQRLLRYLEELRGRYTREVGHNLTNNTLISFGVVRAQIFGQMMCCIALSCPMTNHDDSAACRQSCTDSLIEAGILRRPLALLTRLVLVRKVMKEVMRIVRPDFLL